MIQRAQGIFGEDKVGSLEARSYIVKFRDVGDLAQIVLVFRSGVLVSLQLGLIMFLLLCERAREEKRISVSGFKFLKSSQLSSFRNGRAKSF